MPERLVASLRLLHGCKAAADARCVLVSASRHSDGECLPPRPRTCTDCGLQRSRHEAPTDGTSLRLLCTDCGLQRSRYEAPTDGASLAARCEAEADARCVLVSASWRPDGECLTWRPRTCTDCGLQRSRHEAPTD